MKWGRHDYHGESETHTISWAWMGAHWCVMLWCKSERKYTKRRFCPTEQDRERAIAAFMAVANDNDRSRSRVERRNSSVG